MCIYVFVFMHVYVFVFVFMFICVYVLVFIFVCVYVLVFMFMRVYVLVFMCIYVLVFICVCSCPCVSFVFMRTCACYTGRLYLRFDLALLQTRLTPLMYYVEVCHDAFHPRRASICVCMCLCLCLHLRVFICVYGCVYH